MESFLSALTQSFNFKKSDYLHEFKKSALSIIFEIFEFWRMCLFDSKLK